MPKTPFKRRFGRQHARLGNFAAPPRLRRGYSLSFDVEGLTAPEAASHLSISVCALKSRLHRARSELRTSLSGPAVNY
jgi:DNA-directed RNA polymerase specialized sigma24 family protein